MSSLNEGVELDNEVIEPAKEAAKEFDQAVFQEVVPGEVPELNEDLDISALMTKQRGLDYLQATLENLGGMNQQLAMESMSLVPSLVTADCPLGFYSQDITKTRYSFALEAVEEERKSILTRMWEKFKEWMGKIIHAIKRFLDPEVKEKTLAQANKFSNAHDAVLHFVVQYQEMLADNYKYAESLVQYVHGISESESQVFVDKFARDSVWYARKPISRFGLRLSFLRYLKAHPETLKQFHKAFEVAHKLQDEIKDFIRNSDNVRHSVFFTNKELVSELNSLANSILEKRLHSESSGEKTLTPNELVELLFFAKENKKVLAFFGDFSSSASGLVLFKIDMSGKVSDDEMRNIDENMKAILTAQKSISRLTESCKNFIYEFKYLVDAIEDSLRGYEWIAKTAMSKAQSFKPKNEHIDCDELAKHLDIEGVQRLYV